MPRNIELKARVQDPATATAVAERLCGRVTKIERQIDTYFHCPNGRLKLREIDGHKAELIWYQRPDQAEPKASDYVLVPIPDPTGLKHALGLALGVRGIIGKLRRIYLYKNVRIHLDNVDVEGFFLEFEAVLSDDANVDESERLVAELRREFGIAPADLLAGSYGDMLVPPGR
jgi:predicted adenylyl cyclase CyaB